VAVADVLIVGAGPVGLYLGALLLQHGVTVRILERRTARSAHTRAIGIHPPALAALDRVGAADPLIRRGICIRHGHAVWAGRDIAHMPFAPVSARYPFVLAVPQPVTEAVLEARVLALDGSALLRGAEVTGMHDDGARVSVDAAVGGTRQRFTGAIAVGADGANSAMRQLLGVPVSAKRYREHYLMGDFPESTAYGLDAALFLEAGGIVESFPLPHGVRRWVVRLSAPPPNPDADLLAGLICERTGNTVDAGANSMLSSFGVRSRLADRLVAGRTALIGDAAHEISPIGGQGMNLGWLDAAALEPLILDALQGRPMGAGLQCFDSSRRRAAGRARRQAEINMALGRPLSGRPLRLRNGAVACVAAVPALNTLIARRFTMQ
jgi:2-polyprenyl-6-methoxyphenol hydroxylase-like FAD-dependent oxidoreductase